MELPSPIKTLELDKICRVCLSVKKDMRPLFGEMIADMLMDCVGVVVEDTDGWPDKICLQCVHQVSRSHAFKMRVEKTDAQLRQYIKGITVIVQETTSSPAGVAVSKQPASVAAAAAAAAAAAVLGTPTRKSSTAASAVAPSSSATANTSNATAIFGSPLQQLQPQFHHMQSPRLATAVAATTTSTHQMTMADLGRHVQIQQAMPVQHQHPALQHHRQDLTGLTITGSHQPTEIGGNQHAQQALHMHQVQLSQQQQQPHHMQQQSVSMAQQPQLQHHHHHHHPQSGPQQMIITNSNGQIINASQIVTNAQGQHILQTTGNATHPPPPALHHASTLSGPNLQLCQLVQTSNGTTVQMIQPSNAHHGAHHHQLVQIQRTGDGDRCEIIVPDDNQYYTEDDMKTLANVTSQAIDTEGDPQTVDDDEEDEEVQLIEEIDDMGDVEEIEELEELEETEEIDEIEELDETELEEVQEYEEMLVMDEEEEVDEQQQQDDQDRQEHEHEHDSREHEHDPQEQQDHQENHDSQDQPDPDHSHSEEVMMLELNAESDGEDKEYMAEFISLQTSSPAPGKFVCNLCRQEFKHSRWLNAHMKSHSNWIKANCKKQPQCPICGRSFKGPGMLRMHMKTHEEKPPEKAPTCKLCMKEFKSKTILYRHRQTHLEKFIQCGQCQKCFSTVGQLISHQTKTGHDKIYKCAHCNKVYESSALLKDHVDTFQPSREVEISKKSNNS